MKLKVWWKGDLPLPSTVCEVKFYRQHFWQLYICGQSLTADRSKMAAQLLTVSALVLNDEFRVVIILVRNGRIIELEKRRGERKQWVKASRVGVSDQCEAVSTSIKWNSEKSDSFPCRLKADILFVACSDISVLPLTIFHFVVFFSKVKKKICEWIITRCG